MSEFEFFMGREDRWGDSMRALWGSLDICPLISCIELPYHMAGELDSINCLKIWGDVQKLNHGMAYLLVQADDTSEARTYSLALVWVSPLQTRVSLMVEALEILSSFTSEGSDWPYILIQLYEGTNHMPLPKDKHLYVLPQEKTESPSGWISQLKICQLLSPRPLVIFPIGLNGGDQSVTISLPKPLHTGSSVTTDEYPYIEVNIPSPTPEEQDCTILPQGRKHNTPAVAVPKTPWKPRVTLTVEVNDLLDWGMMDNYDWELEHSAAAEEPTIQVDTSPPTKMEVLVLPLDTSSQASAEGMEAHSSWSKSLIADLPELQSDVHLAINSMFTARRSSDLEMQCMIQDFETSLHQHEAEAVAANEKAKVTHSRRDLQAKVKCTKAVMKAKYDYQVAIQEARVVRCTELEESEATYSEALSKNAATKSLQCTMLCQEHMEHMWELEAWALQAENRSCQDFLLAHQAILHQAPSPSRKIYILLTPFYWDHHHHPSNQFRSPKHPRQRDSHL